MARLKLPLVSKRRFLKADNRTFPIVRLLVEIEHGLKPLLDEAVLVRSTVVIAWSREEAISLSIRSSSANSSIRARRILRAPLLPLVVNCSNPFLSR